MVHVLKNIFTFQAPQIEGLWLPGTLALVRGLWRSFQGSDQEVQRETIEMDQLN